MSRKLLTHTVLLNQEKGGNYGDQDSVDTFRRYRETAGVHREESRIAREDFRGYQDSRSAAQGGKARDSTEQGDKPHGGSAGTDSVRGEDLRHFRGGSRPLRGRNEGAADQIQRKIT